MGSSGFTAGPCSTEPSAANREAWQGQSQLRSAPFQATMQPRWVQRAETACSLALLVAAHGGLTQPVTHHPALARREVAEPARV